MLAARCGRRFADEGSDVNSGGRYGAGHVKAKALRLLRTGRAGAVVSVLPAPLRAVGRDYLASDTRASRQWLRAVMNDHIATLLAEFEQQEVDVLEVSGDLRESSRWRTYSRVEWPQFDLCNPGELPGQYDLVICEQVLEHVAVDVHR